MSHHLEEIYLTAELECKNGNYTEAFKLYHEILQEDPTSASAHNSLGWMYKTQFDDYLRAETHYRTAIKANPAYPHAYWNLCYLLTDMERYDEAYKLLKLCESVNTLDKSLLKLRLGILEEQKGDFKQAIKRYKEGLLCAMSDERLEELKKLIERCEYKQSITMP